MSPPDRQPATSRQPETSRQPVSRREILATLFATVAAAPLGLLACSGRTASGTAAADPATSTDPSISKEKTMQQITPVASGLPVEGMLPSLDGATGWLNSQPLTPDGLRGKVVLVEFGTYTCINWLRTLPYVRAWTEKYQEHGLATLVVHTPEFEFEQDIENVRRAIDDMKIPFPIAIDSDYAIWRAFRNNYWPALYFVDAMGQIRHHRFGEGEYERSEMVIQRLLTEAGHGGFDGSLVSVTGAGAEAAPDWDSLRSPERYLGSRRTEQFASPGGLRAGSRAGYAIPGQLRLNQWALAGDWTVERQAARLHEPGGRIAMRFQARDLHLVMGPATRGAPVRFQVWIDGQAPGPAHGVDADEQGFGAATVQRMYQLIRQPGPIASRQFEIQFLDPGVEAFALTFG